ncbi:nucleotidyltransferase domain-containing protein [Telluribacter sp. SYSU D00476]|uniref:nucleotidyltransferase domain-containing protein n=1 Tax=Telluribacter sp. SYSU D00476 TaxID=2811430 RepID=UPI001FF5A16D|nr:nucleotidyltransferase domain-containing protein [Telluribacter sp. SYSU D00476]
MKTTLTPHTGVTIPEPIWSLANSMKAALREHYGERLEKVILYGSYARGDYHSESDVDLLVVLNDIEVDAAAERKALFDLWFEVFFSKSIKFSLHPVSLRAYIDKANFLYHFVQKEGIEL